MAADPVGDRIEVRDLRAMGIHGVLQQERERAQPFSLDLDIWLDPAASAAAASSDDLADTVDYGDLVARALAVVERRTFALLEALSATVADDLLAADRRITAAAVTVRKLQPPLPSQMHSVGVRVVRHRTIA
jgi:dihydroneopterin aldolase